MVTTHYLWLIPFWPLLSAILLMVTAGQLPKKIICTLGAGSIALSAVTVAMVAQQFLASGEVMQTTLWTWMSVGTFAPGIAFYIDGLTIVMMSVITGVGFLIHLYSLEFMDDDSSFSRYFAYMNLFVAAMLLLVMADNLLLLYLGWEGVGVCSYLLVGFWYRDPNNGKAARKAFVVTRVGDAAMALGLFLLFTELGTLDIQALLLAADIKWQAGDLIPTIAAALLLGGAVGKSAQLPLHTWLPDAMAGPTPVSALIHAATMVTAGVYLIARHYSLFLLAPGTLEVVAWIGLATLLIAAFTALAQNDIKRILAYSTISQIGYMFLALGVSAFSAGIFHLMTHAFFKALLFLAAGAVIHCLHHEHNIFKMGGLRTRLPIVFWSFLIGSSALAALPFTSGFYSKDAILLSAWAVPSIGPWLWAGGVLGALLTAIYSFRLVFVVFFGEAHSKPNKQPGWKMALPLGLLCLLSLIGGWFVLPLGQVFPAHSHGEINHSVEIISIATPLVGLFIAYVLFLGKQVSIAGFTQSSLGKALQNFFFSGWRIDSLYQMLWVCPYQVVSKLWRNEPIDYFYRAIVTVMQWCNTQCSKSQSGELRWYATSMVFGLVILVLIMLRSLS
ncbi:NADH-quinone oxidoreductase subunit L [Dasania marina]|uniref:NADH-quinone oxidoreductase subunit L n=1 Tax=Dasania marina TaxID=471499 RepID=UPI00037B440B|nr:NADH-quinone oxidoreductase subunit L [Dasania marina]